MRNYTEQIEQFGPTIIQAWEVHADKRPLIECDLASNTVQVYDSREYIDSLSERTREAAHLEFSRIINEGGIMVFVKDTKNRVLQSYSFALEAPKKKREPKKQTNRKANPQRSRVR